MKHRINLFLVFLTPLAAVLGVIYQLIIGKDISSIIILIGILPGAIISALKELKSSLPPDKLIVEIDKKLCIVTDSTREEELYEAPRQIDLGDGETISQNQLGFYRPRLTGKKRLVGWSFISIPIRIKNRDFDKKILVQDIKIDVEEDIKQIQDKKNSNELLFNNGENKIIEPTSRKDFMVEIRHENKPLTKYNFSIAFSDNYERTYEKRITLYSEQKDK